MLKEYSEFAREHNDNFYNKLENHYSDA